MKAIKMIINVLIALVILTPCGFVWCAVIKLPATAFSPPISGLIAISWLILLLYSGLRAATDIIKFNDWFESKLK